MGENKIFSKKAFVALILFFSAFTIYSNSMFATFQFDDKSNITENKDITVKDLSYESLKGAALSDVSGFRPVSYLTLAVNYYLSGMDTLSYHIVNTVIHFINSFLIYLIMLKLLCGTGKEDTISVCAFFTALIWLTAPANSQAVIYIVQRMTLLCTLFFLLAFYFYIIGRERGKVTYFILCGILFLLSLLSKQNGVIFPVVIGAYEFAILAGGDLKRVRTNQKVVTASMLIVMVILFLIYFDRIQDSLVRGYAIRDFTLTERLLTQPRVIVFYLSLLALPLPGRFSVTHEIIKSTSLLSPFTTLLAILFLTALFITALLRAKNFPFFSFAILWFFITISVESTFLPAEQVFEHRMYLPCIFIMGAFVKLIVDLLYQRSKAVSLSILIMIAVLFSFSTYVRGTAWEDEVTLWNDVLEKYPEDGRAHYNLGTAYYGYGMYEKAEPHLIAALSKKLEKPTLKFKISAVYNNLGLTRLELGKIDEAEGDFIKAAENEDMAALLYKPYSNLGWIYYIKKDYERAIKSFTEAIRLNPYHSHSYRGLAETHFKLKDYDSSFVAYSRALTLNDKDMLSHLGIGRIYFKKGLYEKAADSFKKALSLDPDNEEVKKELSTTMKIIKGLKKTE